MYASSDFLSSGSSNKTPHGIQKADGVELFDPVRSEHLDIVAEYRLVGAGTFAHLRDRVVGCRNRVVGTAVPRMAVAHHEVTHQHAARFPRFGRRFDWNGVVHFLLLLGRQRLALQQRAAGRETKRPHQQQVASH